MVPRMRNKFKECGLCDSMCFRENQAKPKKNIHSRENGNPSSGSKHKECAEVASAKIKNVYI